MFNISYYEKLLLAGRQKAAEMAAAAPQTGSQGSSTNGQASPEPTGSPPPLPTPQQPRQASTAPDASMPPQQTTAQSEAAVTDTEKKTEAESQSIRIEETGQVNQAQEMEGERFNNGAEPGHKRLKNGKKGTRSKIGSTDDIDEPSDVSEADHLMEVLMDKLGQPGAKEEYLSKYKGLSESDFEFLVKTRKPMDTWTRGSTHSLITIDFAEKHFDELEELLLERGVPSDHPDFGFDYVQFAKSERLKDMFQIIHLHKNKRIDLDTTLRVLADILATAWNDPIPQSITDILEGYPVSDLVKVLRSSGRDSRLLKIIEDMYVQQFINDEAMLELYQILQPDY